jgi:opacity protein-like surface antigen
VKSFSNALIFFFLLSNSCLFAQVKFSAATDVSVMHNFDPQQKFTVIGQTVLPQWHLDKKNTVYAWLLYHANGKYENTLIATAKAPSTQPQTMSFTNQSTMRLRQISFGFKRYLVGSFDHLEKFNLYVAGGFGVMYGHASNTFSTNIDTALYTVQYNVAHGSGDFKRLTFDITGGAEFPVSYEIFIYSEIRMYIPTTDYPSSYLMNNSHAPFLGSINLGIRIIFNADP